MQPSPPGQPNFFIVGAPKSGTTSMATYLSAHPNVLFSDPKEPHYFSSDFRVPQRIGSREAYAALFRARSTLQTAVGEGSVFYLASEEAIPRIEAELGVLAPRYIVMLRDPVEVVRSLHSMYLFAGIEDERDLLTAWRLQGARSRGAQVPHHCPDPRLLQYQEIVRFGHQMERLYATVPRQRVHLIDFDDFTRDPAAAFGETLRFLSLPPQPRAEFPRIHANREARSALVQRVLHMASGMASGVRSALGIERRFGALGALQRANSRVVARAALAPETRNILHEALASDVAKLSEVIGRDHVGWWT